MPLPIVPANSAADSGNDNGLFGYGYVQSPASWLSVSNKVANTGVVATDTTGVGTGRRELAACEYGGDKGIFGYGFNSPAAPPGFMAMTNLVSNTGVIGTDVTGVGDDRRMLAACEYGDDKGIFGYGSSPSNTATTNLVSNTGVVATDTTGVGTARSMLAAC